MNKEKKKNEDQERFFNSRFKAEPPTILNLNRIPEMYARKETKITRERYGPKSFSSSSSPHHPPISSSFLGSYRRSLTQRSHDRPSFVGERGSRARSGASAQCSMILLLGFLNPQSPPRSQRRGGGRSGDGGGLRFSQEPIGLDAAPCGPRHLKLDAIANLQTTHS